MGPGSEVGWDELGDPVVVAAHALRVEQLRPLSAASAVKELAGIAPDAVADLGHQVIRTLLHAVERGAGGDLARSGICELDREHVGEAPKLTGQVCQEVAVVKQGDVRLPAPTPEGL